MGRRRRGLQHMISTKDQLLDKCHPPNISWDGFLRDCEEAVNCSGLQSDEWSSDDGVIAGEERKKNKRPERIANNNSVIKIHEKTWRSTRVCKVEKLFYF